MCKLTCLLDEYTSLFLWSWETYDKFYGLLNELHALLLTRYQLKHEVKLLEKIAVALPNYRGRCSNAVFYREVKYNCVTTDVLCSMKSLLSLGFIEKNATEVEEIMCRTIASCSYNHRLYKRIHSTTPPRKTRRMLMKRSNKKHKTGYLLSRLEYRDCTRF